MQPGDGGQAPPDAAAIIYAIEFDPPDARDAMLRHQQGSIDRLAALVGKVASLLRPFRRRDLHRREQRMRRLRRKVRRISRTG